jgi:O-antigen/teichoic acid export membrane protein
MSIKKSIEASIWGFISTITTGVTQFITVPILLNQFGKDEYGLLILTLSVFSYFKMIDFGLPTSTIKACSNWLPQKKYSKIEKSFQSTILFYFSMGALSSLLLVIIGYYGDSIFNLEEEQKKLFFLIMIIFSFNSILEWLLPIFIVFFSVYNKIDWINKITLIRTLILFIGAISVSYFNLSIIVYSLIYIVSSVLQILFFIFKSKSFDISFKMIFLPIFNYNIFMELFYFGIKLFTMRIFQISANYLRPILLAIFSLSITSIIVDYHIIQTFCSLVISFAGIFTQILLPLTAKHNALNDKKNLDKLLFLGTKYITIFISLLIFGLIINLESLIYLYVGPENLYLKKWIMISLFTLIGLHNSPVSSLIITKGILKPLILFSGINSVLSLLMIILLTDKLGIGSAVLSYLSYTVFQTAFIYIYYVKTLFKIDLKNLFLGSFFFPVCIAIVSSLIFNFFIKYINIEDLLNTIIFNSVCFTIFYLFFCWLFLTTSDEIKSLTRNFKF